MLFVLQLIVLFFLKINSFKVRTAGMRFLCKAREPHTSIAPVSRSVFHLPFATYDLRKIRAVLQSMQPMLVGETVKSCFVP